VASKLIAITDAIVAELNARVADGTLSPTFTAIRRNSPEFKLEDLTTLQVVAVPRGRRKEPEDRETNRVSYVIDVGVRKTLAALEVGAAAANDTTDPLIALLEDIDDDLDSPKLPGYDTARWGGSEWLTDDEMLRQDHLFAAVLTFTFQTLETR